MADETERGVASMGRLGAGFLAVLIPGVAILYAIPALVPNDDDELSPARAVLVVITAVTWSLAVLLCRNRRAPGFAAGLLLGYAAWFVVFILWLAAGP